MYDSAIDTIEHIKEVQKLLSQLSNLLSQRGIDHDNSKLYHPEKELFDLYTPRLKNCTYGSDEYKQYLSELGIARKHHYENNSHHPEHYKDGVNGMDLLDIAEMICDWKAATKRHMDGDILKSIDINTKRFGIDDQLKQILLNTITRLGLE